MVSRLTRRPGEGQMPVVAAEMATLRTTEEEEESAQRTPCWPELGGGRFLEGGHALLILAQHAPDGSGTDGYAAPIPCRRAGHAQRARSSHHAHGGHEDRSIAAAPLLGGLTTLSPRASRTAGSPPMARKTSLTWGRLPGGAPQGMPSALPN